jgi:hypothetical protein
MVAHTQVMKILEERERAAYPERDALTQALKPDDCVNEKHGN